MSSGGFLDPAIVGDDHPLVAEQSVFARRDRIERGCNESWVGRAFVRVQIDQADVADFDARHDGPHLFQHSGRERVGSRL